MHIHDTYLCTHTLGTFYTCTDGAFPHILTPPSSPHPFTLSPLTPSTLTSSPPHTPSCSLSVNYIMEVMIQHGRSLMFVGPTGTGKSVYVKDKLTNHLDRERYQPLVINFSAQTRAGQAQVYMHD